MDYLSWAALILAAVLSQVAEWMYLKYLADWPFRHVYVVELCVVATQYFFMIYANRNLNKDEPVFFLQICWNVTQQVVLFFFMRFALGQEYTGWHIGATIALVTAFVLAAIGTHCPDLGCLSR